MSKHEGIVLHYQTTMQNGGKTNFLYRVSVPKKHRGSTEGIEPGAQPHVAHSFSLNAIAGGCSRLAEQLASPDVVLTSLLLSAGAPTAFAGALESVRRGLATLPQIFISPFVGRQPRRSRVRAVASFLQALMLVSIAVATFFATGFTLGFVALVGIVLFSLSASFGSAAFADIVAKTVPKPARGRLMALRSGLGGVATLLFALMLYLGLGESENQILYISLISLGAILWAITALLFWLIPELPKPAPTQDKNPLEALKRGLRALKTEEWFQMYTVSRGLLIAVEVSIPFLVILTHEYVSVIAIGLLILAAGLAQVVGSPIWGKLLDHASGKTATIVAGVVGLLVLVIALVAEHVGWSSIWIYASIVFVAGFAREGIRAARKTYLINTAPDGEQSFYTAASNSINGVILLVTSLLGLMAQVAGVASVLWLLAVFTLAGTLVSLMLPVRT